MEELSLLTRKPEDYNFGGTFSRPAVYTVSNRGRRLESVLEHVTIATPIASSV
jgi:hypothetical protein